VSGPYGVGLWKHIRRGWGTFAKGVRFEVGLGSKVSFWHDVWCSDQLLKHVFPSLFSIARYKEAWVKDNFIWRNGLVEWNVIFVRSVQDWELDVVSSFFEMLYSCKALHGNEDHICWSPSKKGTFEVKLLCPFKIMRCFHGRVFGTLRCLHKWHFLGGLQLSQKF
jgi:hypothetical protein